MPPGRPRVLDRRASVLEKRIGGGGFLGGEGPRGDGEQEEDGEEAHR
jgi:hypothetical protein